MTTKFYDFYLPYFKQGDDLAHALDSAAVEKAGFQDLSLYQRREQLKPEHYEGIDAQAFIYHAEALEHAAELLRRVAGYAAEHGLKVSHAGIHSIGVEVDDTIGDQLVKEQVLAEPPFFEDMEEDFEDDDFEDEDDFEDDDVDDEDNTDDFDPFGPSGSN